MIKKLTRVKITLLFGAAFVMAACGQKGELYFPTKPPASAESPADATNNSADASINAANAAPAENRNGESAEIKATENKAPLVQETKTGGVSPAP